MHRANDIEFKHELLRKLIHLISLSIPIGYYQLSRASALEIILPLFAVSLALDLGRFYIPSIARWFYRVFRPLLREHERDHDRMLLNGATYVLISAAVCIEWFPKLVTVSAFAVLIISDASAALYGRRFGKHKLFQKSLEGTVAFFVSALIVLAFVPHAYDATTEYLVGAAAALVGAIVESASIELRFDDNLSIPLSMGLTMWGLYYLLTVLDPAKFQPLYDAVMAVR